MKHLAEPLPLNAPDYRLIHGRCHNDGCQHWGTQYLTDETGKRVPGGLLCVTCARNILREYRIVLKFYWRQHTFLMFHVGHNLFDTLKHAQTYADQKNAEQES